MRKVVIALAVLATLAGCGSDSDDRRQGEALDFIGVQRTVTDEHLGACLERSGFVLDRTEAGVAGTTQVMYDNGSRVAVTINVDAKAGKVAPWHERDAKVLKQYGCTVSDAGPKITDNYPR